MRGLRTVRGADGLGSPHKVRCQLESLRLKIRDVDGFEVATPGLTDHDLKDKSDMACLHLRADGARRRQVERTASNELDLTCIGPDGLPLKRKE